MGPGSGHGKGPAWEMLTPPYIAHSVHPICQGAASHHDQTFCLLSAQNLVAVAMLMTRWHTPNNVLSPYYHRRIPHSNAVEYAAIPVFHRIIICMFSKIGYRFSQYDEIMTLRVVHGTVLLPWYIVIKKIEYWPHVLIFHI